MLEFQKAVETAQAKVADGARMLVQQTDTESAWEQEHLLERASALAKGPAMARKALETALAKAQKAPTTGFELGVK